MAEVKPVVNLVQAREVLAPADIFQRLSEQCRTLNISACDVYGDNSGTPSTSSLRAFEAEVAAFLGKEDAVFLPSGVMAQNIVLAISRQGGRNVFLCHHTSHLLLHEHDAYREILSMECWAVGAEEKHLKIRDAMRFEQVVSTVHAQITAAGHEKASTAISAALPGVLIVECPHREVGGKMTSIEDIEAMSRWCKEHHVHFHMDGARLWEALATYPPYITELFDSLYVSFYKGLGGLAGAMLVGTHSYIEQARFWLRRFGGNLFTLLPYHVAAWQGFRQNTTDVFVARRDYLRAVVAAITQGIHDDAVAHEAVPLIRFDPPVPTVSMIHVCIATLTAHDFPADASQPSQPQQHVRQQDEQGALTTMQQVLQNVALSTGIRCLGQVLRPRWVQNSHHNDRTELILYAEFNMGATNMKIPVEDWVRGYVALQQELHIYYDQLRT